MAGNVSFISHRERSKTPTPCGVGVCGQNQDRTGDLPLFRRTLYRLSYRATGLVTLATLTGLEPATSAVTGRRANQLRHRAVREPMRPATSAALCTGCNYTEGSRSGANPHVSKPFLHPYKDQISRHEASARPRCMTSAILKSGLLGCVSGAGLGEAHSYEHSNN